MQVEIPGLIRSLYHCLQRCDRFRLDLSVLICAHRMSLSDRFQFRHILTPCNFKKLTCHKPLIDKSTDFFQGFFPAAILHILKGYEDDRIFALIGSVLFTAIPNLPVCKEPRRILLRLFKEGMKHIHTVFCSEFPPPAREKEDSAHWMQAFSGTPADRPLYLFPHIHCDSDPF